MAVRIVGIASAYPERLLTNSELRDEVEGFGRNDPAEFDRVVEKVQIFSRHVSPPEMTAVDLAEQAASALRDSVGSEFSGVDFLIHCTQSPDYILPTSACILHSRLKLSEFVGAIDVNLGCSGFVYCLSLADAMLTAGHAKKVLLTTADTYTKFIHPGDWANRLIFGDAAAATLLVKDTAVPSSRFLHWTDGAGAQHLILENGGMRQPAPFGTSFHSAFTRLDPASLHMDGYEVFKFGITKVPALIARYQKMFGLAHSDFNWFVPHQANAYMLDELNKRVEFPADRMIRYFSDIGNTVSASIPLAIENSIRQGTLQRGQRLLLAGFGVGLSAAVGEASY